LKEDLVFEALEREKELSYFDITGRYWQNLDRYDSKEIKKLDDIWEKIIPN